MCSDWGECEYDIDLDFFPESIQQLVDTPSDFGLENFKYTYGAGRNG